MKQFIVIALLFIGVVVGRPQQKDENLITENKLNFYYYPTADDQVKIIFNDTESLLAANLKPEAKTIFLIDGFTSPGFTPMNVETKDLFTGRPDINVIIVDWSAYSGHGRITDWTNLLQAFAVYMDVLLNQLPKAGSDLADFIHFVCENTGVRYSDVTLIGLSLGCHTAGATGRTLTAKYNKTIGRIVGEDPALQFSGLDAHVRLRSGDADVVEVYLTNRKQLGDTYHAVGDVSIFVNGGDNQPCETSETEYCHSHVYSYKLYNYLATNDTIKACPCMGAMCLCEGCSFECGDSGISIGPNIPQNARGSYHVKTGFLDWGIPEKMGRTTGH